LNGSNSASALTASVTNAAIEVEFQKLVTEDDTAQAEVDKWLRESKDLKSGGNPDPELQRRIKERFEPVGRAYADFVRRHPNHARARLAYGNFLNDRQDELGAQAQWEKALELDPQNPAVYNNLANRYSESGPVRKAFEFFTKAIELNPSEPLYYHNFADSLCVLRKHAATYYAISENEVLAKAAQLYSNAVRLQPTNFTFATDLAQTYYSMKPLPTSTALAAWTNALQIAQGEPEREEALVHLARVKMLAGQLAEARAQLNVVTNEHCATLKANLLRAIEQREKLPEGAGPASTR
jgi:tetratricopeptide (TPR) repeat protein